MLYHEWCSLCWCSGVILATIREDIVTSNGQCVLILRLSSNWKLLRRLACAWPSIIFARPVKRSNMSDQGTPQFSQCFYRIEGFVKVRVCVCMCIYTYMCVYIYIYIFMYIFIYIYISLSLYIYIYICMCVHVYKVMYHNEWLIEIPSEKPMPEEGKPYLAATSMHIYYIYIYMCLYT